MTEKKSRNYLKVYDSFAPVREYIENALAINEDLKELYFDHPLAEINTQEKFDRAFRRSKVIDQCLTESLSTLEKVLDAIDLLDRAAPAGENP